MCTVFTAQSPGNQDLHVQYTKLIFFSLLLQLHCNTPSHYSNSNDLREKILDMISHNPKGHMDKAFRDKITNMLQEYASCSPTIDPQDIVFTIGAEIYGAKLEFPHHDDTSTTTPVIVDFDYMKQFMKDVFLAYEGTLVSYVQ